MIIVFVGAGGSASVDPTQYPTTVEFFQRLPQQITSDQLFTLITAFLRAQKKEGQSIDIEEILWRLRELEEYFLLSCHVDTIGGWMMNDNRLCQLKGNIPDYSKLQGGMSEIWASLLIPLRNKIQALVHEFYDDPPHLNKLSNWIQFLQSLATNVDPKVEIFTTNYDIVLEKIIEQAGIKIETGRQATSTEMKLDTIFWDNPETPMTHPQTSRGRLTKLHGSVDWQRRKGDIICSSVYTEDPQKHLILYPGFKGTPDEEPFNKFHEHLRAVVRKADAAIFVGYAFRDEYIKDILSGLRPEIPVHLINKDEFLPDLPFTNEYTHFSDGFTAKVVQDCIRDLVHRCKNS